MTRYTAAREQIETALRDKGYRPTWHTRVPKHSALTCWVGSRVIYILQEHDGDGSLELYGQVDPDGNSVTGTVAAIVDSISNEE